jgi:hypothetical protein
LACWTRNQETFREDPSSEPWKTNASISDRPWREERRKALTQKRCEICVRLWENTTGEKK